MTIQIERDALLAAVQQVAGVVASRNTITVLSNLLIEATDGRVTVTGTDLDIQAASHADATFDASFATTVQADKLLAAVASFKPGTLTIEPVDGRAAITIKMGRGMRTLATLPAEDFPKRKPPEKPVGFSISGRMLARLLDNTASAHSTEETRYYLCGTFLHVSEDRFFAAATDGFRLVRVEMAVPDGAAKMPDVIVGTKTVNLLRKLLAKFEGDATLHIAEAALSAEIGRTTLTAKLIDGTYPAYQRIIPTSGSHVIKLARDALAEPVAAVAAVIDAEGERRVRNVKFEIGDGEEHQVSARDDVGASACEPLDAVATGGAIEFGVNHQFLGAAVKLFAESGVLTVAIQDSTAPILITSDKDPDLIAVVMPIRV